MPSWNLAWIFATNGRKPSDNSMSEKIPVRQALLADQVLEILIERIINGGFFLGGEEKHRLFFLAKHEVLQI